MTELEQELQKYASIGNDEISEVSTLLLNLSKYKPYLSKEFNNIVQKEMKRLLKNYQDFCEIKSKTQIHTYSFLEWK